VSAMRSIIDDLRKKLLETPDDRKGLETFEFISRQFHKWQEKWSKAVGIDRKMRVAEVIEETIARETVKRDMALEDTPDTNGREERPVSGTVFDIDALVG